MGRKATKQLENSATDLLAERVPQERAGEIAKLLTAGTWTHDYPILPRPEEVMELMTLYPQPTRTLANVQYLPTRRERPVASPAPARTTPPH